MKLQQYILSMILTLSTTVVSGQTVGTSDTILVDELKKTWYYSGITPDSLVLYRSNTHTPRGYGARMEFHYNGDFVDAYSAPCGNDSNIHHWTGHWTLDQDHMQLTMVTYDEGRETLAEIKKLTSTYLILRTIKTEVFDTD